MFNTKGFSLIEVVIVITILAILATVGLFAYNSVIDRARYSELCADAKIYQIAAQSAIVDLGIPTNEIVWGDSEAETGDWAETNWLGERIDNGILVTILQNGKVDISFLEGNENYSKYASLVEKFGELT